MVKDIWHCKFGEYLRKHEVEWSAKAEIINVGIPARGEVRKQLWLPRRKIIDCCIYGTQLHGLKQGTFESYGGALKWSCKYELDKTSKQVATETG